MAVELKVCEMAAGTDKACRQHSAQAGLAVGTGMHACWLVYKYMLSALQAPIAHAPFLHPQKWSHDGHQVDLDYSCAFQCLPDVMMKEAADKVLLGPGAVYEQPKGRQGIALQGKVSKVLGCGISWHQLL